MDNFVDAFFNWGNDKNRDSIEDKYIKTNIHVSNWGKVDTLYSFIGLYQIGIYVYYPNLCKRTDCTIKQKDGKFYGFDDLFRLENGRPLYKKFKSLNGVIEKSGFLKVFDSVGNVIPIWPGGNIDKGIRAYCFDLPDIYLCYKYENWYRALCNMFPDAYLEYLYTSEFSVNTKAFLDNMSKNKYERYLNHIVNVIKYRKQMLEK